jgi:spermidine synthase
VGSVSGEVTGLLRGWWLWFTAVFPVGVLGGLAFPLLAGQLGAGKAGAAYAAESAGALFGGVAVTVALIWSGTVPTIVVALGLVAALTFSKINPILAASALVLSFFFTSSASDALAPLGRQWAERPANLERWTETLHQRLELSDGFPASLYVDGNLAATVPDPYLTESRAHLLMLLHPDPERVLGVGCIADGTYSTLISHSYATTFRFVEPDPALSRLLPTWYSRRGLVENHTRDLETTPSDPVRAVRNEGKWDLVLLLDSDPVSIRSNRTRTVHFLQTCREHIDSHGILVLRTGVSDTYIGGLKGRLLSILHSTLTSVFPHVNAVPGDDVLLIASNTPVDLDVATLKQRWSERGLSSDYFVPEMLELLIDPQRQLVLRYELAKMVGPLNTVLRPRAVLVASGISEGRTEHKLHSLIYDLEQAPTVPLILLLLLVVSALLAVALTRRFRASAAASVVGFSSMGVWLVLLLVWQSTHGSVFTHVGMLSALFMAGLWIGSATSRKHTEPEKLLPFLLPTGAALALVSASSLSLEWPLLFVPGLLLATGAVTGGAFAGIAVLAHGADTRRGSGKAFAAEELGAAFGALFVTLVALPTVGLTMTVIGLAVLQLAAIPVVLSRR